MLLDSNAFHLFCIFPPLSNEGMGEYCLVIIGNKTDVAPGSIGSAVPEGFYKDDVHFNSSGNSMPTFAIPPRTHSIDFHSHHHKNLLEARSRTSQSSLLPNTTHTGLASFRSFHVPASFISGGYQPYHSAKSSHLSHSRSPSCSPLLHNHRPSLAVGSATTMLMLLTTTRDDLEGSERLPHRSKRHSLPESE
ncbi:hypothetical protein BGY98DRAFT_1187688 [Russula aff. rugulosa BPL654]|nr:hypothetical protein BGY98DRAFT_1187688 [Russula aff. rugulosa BPL654]